MYEDKTFGNLMLEKINYFKALAKEQNITIDTSTGSMTYFALAANAFETGQAYIELDQVLNESYADTASRDFLIRRAKERGIFVDPATFAIRKGIFNIPVPIGAEFSLNKLNYVVIASGTEVNTYQLQCTKAGNIGNLESGALIPNEYIDGLTSAQLTDVLIPGKDEEGTEHLRSRYFDSLLAQPFGGNIQNYVEKIKSLNGVGGVKVYPPVWSSGETIKLVIIDSQFNAPSGELVDAVQTAIDPVQNQGTGLGIAPIGHVVIVVGVNTESVDIHLNITFLSGWDWETLKPSVQDAINAYFSELATVWDGVDWLNDKTASLVVRTSQIETRILGISGILDIRNTELNGQPLNLVLDANSIAVLGELTNE